MSGRSGAGRSTVLIHWDACSIALVLAPFFVHLEILFKLGYKPALRDSIHQGVKAEIAKIKAAEADGKKKSQ